MARERSRNRPNERGRPAGPESPPDPIGRLDDVLATLEQMLDGRGVSPAPGPGRTAGRESPAEERAGSETLPLLRDMVPSAVTGRSEWAAGESDPLRPMVGTPPLTADRIPLSLGFEFIADEPLPRIGDLDLGLESPVDDPVDDPMNDPVDDPGGDRGGDRGGERGGERYGDAPPPSLDPEVYRHLIDRLANEIDVIVQTGAEEAMRHAAADIAAQVREHVAIILPEVIEELVRMSSRPRD